MNETTGAGDGALQAYHDGELRGLARWRFERRLRRSPELRRELAALARLSELVRAADAPVPGPDLWDRVALRLPAVDARRRADREAPAHGWWRPIGAAAALAVAALGLVYWEAYRTAEPRPGTSVVRWMDSGGRPVMLLEEKDSGVTIIWLLDGTAEGAARGGASGVA
jgi:anti-sigma factor RsiW